jgi:hypothetical protein
MTLNGVEVVRDQAMARLPFADNDLVEFTQTMPPWMKFERVLFNNVFIQAFPKLARVPNTHTGLPMISDARELSMRFQQMIRWHLRKRAGSNGSDPSGGLTKTTTPGSAACCAGGCKTPS